RESGFFSQVVRAVGLVWKGSPFWMVFNGTFQVLQGIFPILSLLLLKMMVDEVSAAASGSVDAPRLIFIILLTGAVTLLSNLIGLLGSWGNREQGRHMADFMNGIIMKKAGEVDFSYFENPEHQDELERAVSEAQFRPGEIVSTMASLIQNGVSLAGVVILIFQFHPLIVAILLLSALPGLLTRIFFSNREYLNERSVTEKERRASYFQFLMLDRDCAKEVRLFNLTGELFGQFTALREELREVRHNLDRRNTLVSSFSSAFMVFLVFAAYLWVARDVMAGSVTVGAFVMFYQAFQRGQGFLRSFLGGVASLYGHNLFLRNLYQFLDYEPTLSAPEHPDTLHKPVRGEIDLKEISFTYPNTNKVILDRLSLSLRSGEVVALVGENGCGKTTLIKLICRLYDVKEGAILLDGVDFRRLTPGSVADQVGVIFQDFMEYNMTVAQNIAYGDMSSPPDRERIEGAAKKAGIHRMIEALPQGYDTVLGVFFTNGQELSGGQWQKIAMARAFYKDAPVIILDEPTSSLDPKAEYEIFNRFKEILSDRTALLVSHRMATVRMADRICVMDKGRIAEEGSHEELMERRGIYYDLFTTQAMNYL
ncbi:MAG: ABC transporter ATP-binding protein, partial [Spirochaetales bacterium]|nr:ABC transporter ATP-binding protein [Spirochaetales bacterium]